MCVYIYSSPTLIFMLLFPSLSLFHYIFVKHQLVIEKRSNKNAGITG